MFFIKNFLKIIQLYQIIKDLTCSPASSYEALFSALHNIAGQQVSYKDAPGELSKALDLNWDKKAYSNIGEYIKEKKESGVLS